MVASVYEYVRIPIAHVCRELRRHAPREKWPEIEAVLKQPMAEADATRHLLGIFGPDAVRATVRALLEHSSYPSQPGAPPLDDAAAAQQRNYSALSQHADEGPAGLQLQLLPVDGSPADAAAGGPSGWPGSTPAAVVMPAALVAPRIEGGASRSAKKAERGGAQRSSRRKEQALPYQQPTRSTLDLAEELGKCSSFSEIGIGTHSMLDLGAGLAMVPNLSSLGAGLAMVPTISNLGRQMSKGTADRLGELLETPQEAASGAPIQSGALPSLPPTQSLPEGPGGKSVSTLSLGGLLDTVNAAFPEAEVAPEEPGDDSARGGAARGIPLAPCPWPWPAP